VDVEVAEEDLPGLRDAEIAGRRLRRRAALRDERCRADRDGDLARPLVLAEAALPRQMEQRED